MTKHVHICVEIINIYKVNTEVLKSEGKERPKATDVLSENNTEWYCICFKRIYVVYVFSIPAELHAIFFANFLAIRKPQ